MAQDAERMGLLEAFVAELKRSQPGFLTKAETNIPRLPADAGVAVVARRLVATSPFEADAVVLTVPRAAILVQGTAALMAYLRDRIPK